MTSPAALDAMLALAEAFFGDGELTASGALFEAVLTLRAGDPRAHFGLKLVCDAAGDTAGALRHQQLAFAKPFITALPYEGTAPPVDVLVVLSGNGGNLVSAPLIDRGIVRGYSLVVEGYDPAMVLPPHHVLFNGVGDADRSPEALDRVERVLDATRAPVINHPANVRATGRAAIAQRLAAVPGARTARTALLPRAEFTAEGVAARGFAFPLLVRAPGFHTGEHFDHVADAGALEAALAPLPGDALFAIAFLDARDDDGAFRKYRVLFIGGRLYPLHLAIGSQWKVHYFSADMAERADYRTEEAAFLADMPGVLGPRVMATLERIRDLLGLDYGGIDFSIDGDGNVLVFEANATMVVLHPGDDERFAYRAPAVERVLAAVRAMMRDKAALGGYVPA